MWNIANHSVSDLTTNRLNADKWNLNAHKLISEPPSSIPELVASNFSTLRSFLDKNATVINECQNLQTSIFTFLILFKVWFMLTIVTDT